MTVVAYALMALLVGVQVEEGPSRASAQLNSLFSNDDYPPGALRRGVEGTVGFSVEVDSNGGVADCRITATSGDSELDTTTCALIRERARFRPARDAQGRPLPDTVDARITWRLADPSPYWPVARDEVVVRLTWLDPDPVCMEAHDGQPEVRLPADRCLAMFGPAVSAIREARGALELTFFGTFAPGGQLPHLDATAASGELIWAQQAELEIAPTGEVRNCRMTRSVRDATGAFPFLPRMEMCAVFRMGTYRFEPDADTTTVRRLDVSHSYRVKRRE